MRDRPGCLPVFWQAGTKDRSLLISIYSSLVLNSQGSNLSPPALKAGVLPLNCQAFFSASAYLGQYKSSACWNKQVLSNLVHKVRLLSLGQMWEIQTFDLTMEWALCKPLSCLDFASFFKCDWLLKVTKTVLSENKCTVWTVSR